MRLSVRGRQRGANGRVWVGSNPDTPGVDAWIGRTSGTKEMMPARSAWTRIALPSDRCAQKVVCEIGVGLGPLSHGPQGRRKTDAGELDPEVLRTATRHHWPERIRPRALRSDRGTQHAGRLPEKVDVLLSETLDSKDRREYGAVYAGRARATPPTGGIFLPARITCVTALARPRVWEEQRRFWTDTMQSAWDLDYQGMLPTILPMNRVIEVHHEDLLSKWAVWQRVDFQDPRTFHEQSMALLLAESTGEVTGLARAFVADMGAGVTLSTTSSQPLTCWKQFFAPFERPLQMQRGDGLFVEFTANEPDYPGLSVRSQITHVPAAALPGFVDDLRKRLAGNGGTPPAR